MEEQKSGFEISEENRQDWKSIAMVWIGAMICVSCLMVGGLPGNGMKLGTSIITILIGYGIVCFYMCFMGMQGCDTGLPTAVMAGGAFTYFPIIAFLNVPFFSGPVNGIITAVIIYVIEMKFVKNMESEGDLVCEK